MAQRPQWSMWLKEWRETISRDRVDELVLRLRGLGFNQEIPYLGFRRKPLVDHMYGGIPRALTAPEWARIKPHLVAWMTDRRERRQMWERRQACSRRLKTFTDALGIAIHSAPPHTDLPLPLDIAKYPEIETILNLSEAAYVPVDAYAELLPPLLERWSAEAKASLRALVVPSPPILAPTSQYSTRQATRDELSLARSVFRCSGCRGTFHARELYAHPCLYGQAVDIGGMLPYALALDDGRLPRFECSAVESARLIHYDGYQPWSTSALRYYGNVAEHIIRLCDKDASVARIADLENCATRLVCRICSVRRRRVLVMNWLCAIDHIIDVHPSRLHDALQKAPMDVSIAARQLDQAYESRMQREQVDTLGWECSRCLFGRLQWLGRADVMAHMQSKHGTASDFDCHQRADARRPESMPVLLLANALKHTEDHDAWEREWMWHHRRRFGYTDLRQGGLEEV
ncbi:hypothetical protein FOMPIDRAFT_94364 [Fomitopsis schrenkii]|uniref:Uncharacterized protein n=1 Tax=Fomitopsis schrenkii TaxID=2126942 RepID=S8FER9_FOMSC|nr:hypothetical protein FOMPIDRAFT_94364 [Fomitopsis schrenkii]